MKVVFWHNYCYLFQSGKAIIVETTVTMNCVNVKEVITMVTALKKPMIVSDIYCLTVKMEKEKKKVRDLLDEASRITHTIHLVCCISCHETLCVITC